MEEPEIKENVGGDKALTQRAIRTLLDEGKLMRSGQGRRGDPYLYYNSHFLISSTYINEQNEKSEDIPKQAALMMDI